MKRTPLFLLALISVTGLPDAGTAQAYPQITATTRNFLNGVFGGAGAEATVSEGGTNASQMSLGSGTDVTAGFDLQVSRAGTTARAVFTLDAEPLRIDARCSYVNTSTTGPFIVARAEVPVELVITSSQSINLVLALRATFVGPGGLTNGTCHVWLGTSAASSSTLAWLTPSTSNSAQVPLSLSAGVPTSLFLACGLSRNAFEPQGTFECSAVLEVQSVTASYDANFAPGCVGSAGQATLATAGGNPVLGTTFDLLATGIPSGAVAVGLLGFQNVPLDLASLGAPGCIVATDIASLMVLPHAAGSGTWSLPIPNQASLLSLAFLQQCAVLDPPANALGLSLSNCGRGVFGQ